MKEKPACPKCKAPGVVKSGKVQGKQIVICQSCNYQFTRLIPPGRPAKEKDIVNTLDTPGLSMRAITYARRYALTPMLGTVTEDDDSEAAKLPPKANSRQIPPQPGQNTSSTRNRQFRKSVSEESENNMENLPSLDRVIPFLDKI